MQTAILDAPIRVKGDKKKQQEGNLLHGWARTTTYQSWNNMRQRCENPNNRHYMQYGGRGITIDPEWKNFINFLRDMGPRPGNLEVDRIDNEKGYFKENCRWATRSQQLANRRNTIFVEVEGQRMTLIEACKILGLPYHTIYCRLYAGFSPADALRIPIGRVGQRCAR